MKVRRLLRWAGIAIVALSGTLVFLIHNDSFQQWILRRLEYAARAGGMEFSAKHIHFDPYRLQATLDGVAYTKNEVSLHASRVTIDLPWNVLTSSVKEITNLELDNLEIKVDSPEPLVPAPSGRADTPSQNSIRPACRSEWVAGLQKSVHAIPIPAFSLDVNQGQGSLRFAASLSLPPDLSMDIDEIRLSLSDDGVQFSPVGLEHCVCRIQRLRYRSRSIAVDTHTRSRYEFLHRSPNCTPVEGNPRIGKGELRRRDSQDHGLPGATRQS